MPDAPDLRNPTTGARPAHPHHRRPAARLAIPTAARRAPAPHHRAPVQAALPAGPRAPRTRRLGSDDRPDRVHDLLTQRQLSVVPGLLDRMSITQHLAVIDRLCSEEFPAEPGRSDVGTAGPGYHVAELRTSADFWEDDGTRREETEEQYEADRDALSERLAERWGAPDVFSLWSVLDRSMDGEDLPEPWAVLSPTSRTCTSGGPTAAGWPSVSPSGTRSCRSNSSP